MTDRDELRTLNPPPAGLVLVWWQGFIVAVSRRNNAEDLNLPGGKLKPYELASVGAARELAEETGLELPAHRLTLVYTRDTGTPSGRMAHVFSVALTDSVPRKLIAETGLTARWVRPERLLRKECSFRDFNAAMFESLGILVETPDQDRIEALERRMATNETRIRGLETLMGLGNS